jgi:hypothetical protein
MEDKMRSWAPHALDVDVESTLAAIEVAATVDLIGTFGDLKCAEPDEAVPDVVRDPSRQDFDYLPVRKNGRITGLFGVLKSHVSWRRGTYSAAPTSATRWKHYLRRTLSHQVQAS